MVSYSSIRKSKNYVAIVLVAIFSLYYASSTMFGHSHIINGVTVVHSHFHLPGNAHHQNADGGHTLQEIGLIASINASVQQLVISLSFNVISCFVLVGLLMTSCPARTVSIHHNCSGLRAPPALCL